MTKKIILIIFLALLTSCGEEVPAEYRCGVSNIGLSPFGTCRDATKAWKETVVCREPEERAEFIIKCATAATNRMSSSGGVDVVAQCETTASRLFCISEKVYYKK